MSGRTQFWVGSLMLAVAVGALVGGLLYPRPSYSQGLGEGRAGNFALVASSLGGAKAKSQIVYLVDDRTEAMYILEASANEGKDNPSMVGFCDLRRLSEKVGKIRSKYPAEKDK
jgi:hypothetical protein